MQIFATNSSTHQVHGPFKIKYVRHVVAQIEDIGISFLN